MSEQTSGRQSCFTVGVTTAPMTRPYNVVVGRSQDKKAAGGPRTEAACLPPLLPVSGHT